MRDEAIRRQLKRSAVTSLIEQVMKEESLTLPEATKCVYDSKLFEMINDDGAWLYREGPVYLYDLLKEERQGC